MTNAVFLREATQQLNNDLAFLEVALLDAIARVPCQRQVVTIKTIGRHQHQRHRRLVDLAATVGECRLRDLQLAMQRGALIDGLSQASACQANTALG